MAMAQYRLRVGASGPPNTTPAWRTAMTVTDKVYEVGGLPSVLSSSITWPAAGAGNFLMNGGGDGNAYRLHASYGGSVFVPELGTYGTMVFGRTGEATIDNQLTSFPLSDDTPAWSWFQQPDYQVSEAEAITAGSDWYYSEADYAALPSGDKIDVVGEATFSATWDGTFPVGYKNWIARRKHQGSITGNSRPWFFRYNMPRYIPPAMTGTANGAIVVTMEGTKYGPFGQNPTPTGAVASDWFADVWPSGNLKNYLYAMDVQTKVWQRLATPIPDYTAGSGETLLPVSCVENATKRVHYLTISGTNRALYYADFSAGLAGMTITTPVAVTDSTGGAAPDLDSNSVLCEVVGGALGGKALWLMKDSGTTPAMLMIDLADGTYRKLTIASLPTDSEWWGFAFDQANTRVIITTKSSAGGVKSYRAVIPTDFTNAAAWSFAMTDVVLGGVTVEAGGSWQYGDRSKYLDDLGVILMTQIDNKMLAYRPGA